jgi:hypothetical protein
MTLDDCVSRFASHDIIIPHNGGNRLQEKDSTNMGTAVFLDIGMAQVLALVARLNASHYTKGAFVYHSAFPIANNLLH